MNYAFHSPQMEHLARELVDALGEVDAGPASIPLYSTVTGAAIAGEALDAAYWGRNVRAPVLFALAVASAFGDGKRLYLEVGPHPVLATNLAQCLAGKREAGHVVHTLRRQTDDRLAMLDTLGRLYTTGFEIDWKGLQSAGGRCVTLPTYPWQRERYWVEASTGGDRARPKQDGHPLLGRLFQPANHPGTHYWEQRVSVADLPYLADHRVAGELVFPGAGFVEMALAAAKEVVGEESFVLQDLAFEWMLVLAEGESRRVQVSLVEEQESSLIEVSSRDEASGDWVRHATARVQGIGEVTDEGMEPPERSRERCPTEVEGAAHYAWMAARQIDYGAAFRGVEHLWVGAGEALARVQLPEEAGPPEPYRVHPALLDACLQVSAALFAGAAADGTIVPVEVGRVRLRGRPTREVWVRALLSHPAADEHDLPLVDIAVVNERGWPFLENRRPPRAATRGRRGAGSVRGVRLRRRVDAKGAAGRRGDVVAGGLPPRRVGHLRGRRALRRRGRPAAARPGPGVHRGRCRRPLRAQRSDALHHRSLQARRLSAILP